MATNPNFISIVPVTITNTTGTIPAGFQTMSILNNGDATATITQNELPWPLPAGKTYNFLYKGETTFYNSVDIDATGTVVICTYI